MRVTVVGVGRVFMFWDRKIDCLPMERKVLLLRQERKRQHNIGTNPGSHILRTMGGQA